MSKPTLVVLAAGMGSRYGGLKQLDGVGPSGETIMDYSVFDAIKGGFGKVVFVVRSYFREEFEKRARERYGNSVELGFAEQELDKIPGWFSIDTQREKPWGTGHAVLVAEDLVNTPFAVINADDYYGRNTFSVIGEYLSGTDPKENSYAMVGFCAGNTLSESGFVSRGVCTMDSKRFLTSVEEHHKISKDADGRIYGDNSKGERVLIDPDRPVSMNVWGFTPGLFEEGRRLFDLFLKERGHELKSEFYIPYIVNKLIEEEVATCKVLQTPDNWFGVTYKEDRPLVTSKIEELCNEGVYPVPLFKK